MRLQPEIKVRTCTCEGKNYTGFLGGCCGRDNIPGTAIGMQGATIQYYLSSNNIMYYTAS